MNRSMLLTPVLLALLSACGGSGSSSGSTEAVVADDGTTNAADGDEGTNPGSGTDDAATPVSTAAILCDYVDSTLNNQASLTYTSESEWSCDTERRLAANGIPDHEIGEFPNPANPNTISEQSVDASFPLNPVETGVPTTLGGPRGPAGYILNGIKIDANTGGSCDNSGNSCSLGEGGLGWNIEALGQDNFDFGTDSNNAHVQPGGSYHYHGMPEGFIEKRGGSDSTITLIGWAADGFPIYARYGYSQADDARSEIVAMEGSYVLVSTVPDDRPPVETYPLGTFVQDWVYEAGSGDLDACNGRFGVTPEFPGGVYHYYATDSYPFLQRCVTGQVN